MAKWLLRGLVFAALMVVIRLVQGALINQFETRALLISVVLVVLYAVVVLAWGLLDGRNDARRTPDPDRRSDLAMTWLLTGLVAGLLSGAVSWFISMIYPALYAGGLINELTTFAAFTALLTFVPAVLAVAIGRWLVDRNAPPFERRREDGYDERADTDVFAAVRDDRTETEDGTQPVEQQSAVATLERDEQTADEQTTAEEVQESSTDDTTDAVVEDDRKN